MTTQADAPPRPSRRRDIDWARGLAVLIMIEAHTLDAWVRSSAKVGGVYIYLLGLAGFAAPLFLWLAGLSLVLSAERTVERSRSRAAAGRAVIRRGAEVYGFGIFFRLLGFLFNPFGGVAQIFRVDILNVMGIGLCLAGLLWWLSRGARRAALLLSGAAVAITLMTPLVHGGRWEGLPAFFQWHLQPSGEFTTFSLFPWTGFVFAGAATGALLALCREPGPARRLSASLAVAGVALIWLGFYTAGLPSIYRASSFWISSPTFFAIRAGILLVALALLYVLAEFGPGSVPGVNQLEELGKNSLFIYWLHVEVVYGAASRLIQSRLPLWGMGIGFLVLTLLMFPAVAFRDWILALWRRRISPKSGSAPVPA